MPLMSLFADKKKSELVNIDAFLPEKLDNFRVEDLVTEYLNAQNLDILPENELGDAVRMFVEKDDKDAIKEYVSLHFVPLVSRYSDILSTSIAS